MNYRDLTKHRAMRQDLAKQLVFAYEQAANLIDQNKEQDVADGVAYAAIMGELAGHGVEVTVRIKRIKRAL